MDTGAARQGFTAEQALEVAEAIGVDFPAEAFDLDQFRRGMDVELEHGRRDPATNVTDDDPIVTGRITLAHLREIADYYDRLDEMEAEAEP
jgi:hypothetical protein